MKLRDWKNKYKIYRSKNKPIRVTYDFDIDLTPLIEWLINHKRAFLDILSPL